MAPHNTQPFAEVQVVLSGNKTGSLELEQSTTRMRTLGVVH